MVYSVLFRGCTLWYSIVLFPRLRSSKARHHGENWLNNVRLFKKRSPIGPVDWWAVTNTCGNFRKDEVTTLQISKNGLHWIPFDDMWRAFCSCRRPTNNRTNCGKDQLLGSIWDTVSRIEKLNNNVIPTMAHVNRLAILSAHESLLRRMYLNDFSSSTTSAMSLTPPTASVNTSSLSQNNVIHSNHSFLKTEDFEIPDKLIIIASF